MRVDQLFEGVSDILFHYTRLDQFFSMVSSGTINLSPSQGYESNINKGYSYFLSTTRSRVGSFHVSSRSGVLITLNGRRLKQNMYGSPSDYWDGEQPGYDEMEDRIYSNSPSIELSRNVIKVDILIDENMAENEDLRDQFTRLKNEGFPIYVYDNQRDWVSGRDERALYIINNGRFKVNFQLIMKRKQ